MSRPLDATAGALVAALGMLASFRLPLPDGAGYVFGGSWIAFMVASFGTAYFENADALWILTIPAGVFLLVWTPIYVAAGIMIDILAAAWQSYPVNRFLALVAALFTLGWFGVLVVRR